ncbi:hypothetical protein HD599_001261 [Conyzicola lurida]|uniref:DUF3040 domain-containing protein n=1 Tax=Conyzicola lurida TaxID=1172621 RepID=A0A841AKR6_9MICO|nr:DUF3040 domain-containing protein [Conyzicola lurida]MBB5842938.1 hypothetical protein [Conyzicola lurida]
MPLSEQEQRLLEEMERGLYQNDADFVATVGQRRGKPNYTIVVVGVLLGILGIATLLVGVVIQQPLVGILGFVIMFGGVLLAIAPPRRAEAPIDPTRSNKPGKAKSGGFMDGLNDRWDKRQDERGR